MHAARYLILILNYDILAWSYLPIARVHHQHRLCKTVAV